MKLVSFFLLAVSLYSADAISCRNGWTAYKDEVCLKVFDSLLSYEAAKEFCSSQGDDTSLVMIKEEAMQQAVANYTKDIFNSVWIGGEYDHESGQFVWADGEPLTYTHWQVGFPRNATGNEDCIELRPPNSKFSPLEDGNWANVNCQKQNKPICQSDVTWTLEDTVAEIKNLRKQLKETQQNLEDMSTTVIPVGSIYIEYYHQATPRQLWPNLEWQDISDTYSGLFFRVTGSGSESWGTTQAACAPRIVEVKYGETTTAGQFQDTNVLPVSGWSPFTKAGVIFMNGEQVYEGLQFNTEGCSGQAWDVRPKNQAVRIWKRIW